MHDGTSLPREICTTTEDASETKASVLAAVAAKDGAKTSSLGI